MQLVSKLEQQSGNSDGSCRVARQILDFFELHVGDYRMNQVLIKPGAHHKVVWENMVGKGSSMFLRTMERDMTLLPALQVINISRNTDVVLKAFQQTIHEK